MASTTSIVAMPFKVAWRVYLDRSAEEVEVEVTEGHAAVYLLGGLPWSASWKGQQHWRCRCPVPGRGVPRVHLLDEVVAKASAMPLEVT